MTGDRSKLALLQYYFGESSARSYSAWVVTWYRWVAMRVVWRYLVSGLLQLQIVAWASLITWRPLNSKQSVEIIYMGLWTPRYYALKYVDSCFTPFSKNGSFRLISETQFKAEARSTAGIYSCTFMELGEESQKQSLFSGKQKSESSPFIDVSYGGLGREKSKGLEKRSLPLPSFSLETLSQWMVRTWIF